MSSMALTSIWMICCIDNVAPAEELAGAAVTPDDASEHYGLLEPKGANLRPWLDTFMCMLVSAFSVFLMASLKCSSGRKALPCSLPVSDLETLSLHVELHVFWQQLMLVI